MFIHLNFGSKIVVLQQYGKVIITIGVLIIFIGIIVYLFGDKLSFLGRLPGDIRIEKDNFRFYFPITTMILVSLVVSIILRIARWLW